MTKAVVSDAADDTLADAASIMRGQQTGSLLIMDGQNLLGIFTERDLLKAIAAGQDPSQAHLKDFMSTEIISVSPDTTLREAAGIMAAKWIRHLPVVDGDRVVGLISQRDLTGVLAKVLNEPEQSGVAEEDLVRSKRLRRIEVGDLD